MSTHQSHPPFISVIIPVFNDPERVVQAVASVLKQTYHNYEVIVVDDGSSPPQSLPDTFLTNAKIQIVRCETNKGQGVARNLGASKAKGDWLAWLDADDTWHPEKLAKQVAFIENLGKAAKRVAIATGYETINTDGGKSIKLPVEPHNLNWFFAGCWYCPGSTTLLSRELFEITGPYDENLRRLEDLDWFARMALKGGALKILPQPLATISKSGNATYKNVTEAKSYLLQKFHPRDNDELEQAYPNLKAYLELECAASAIKRDKNYFKGLVHLFKSWALHPRLSLHLFKFWQAD